MRAVILWYLLGIVPFFGFAQSIKPHVVEIPNHGIFIPNQRFNITGVLDNRVNNESIGIVQKGMGGRQVPAVFPRELAVYLLEFFQHNLSTYVGVPQVILKVDRLYISERALATEGFGFAELAVEMLVEENGEILSLGRFESNMEESAFDVTASHGERLYQVLLNCLHQFAASDMAPVVYTQSEREIDPIDYKILMRKGLFKNYSEWSNPNSKSELPTDFQIRRVNDGGTAIRYQPIDPRTNKRIKGVFAMSDGQSFYINSSQYTAADYFVRATALGRYFLFEDQVTDPVAGAAFGLLGSLASTSKNLYVFDTKSGLVRVLDTTLMKELLLPYPELMDKWKNSNGKRDVKKELIESINSQLLK